MKTEPVLQKIYVTRYALSDGVFSVDAEISGDERAGMATYKLPECYPEHIHGKDWWLTEDEALKHAEEMRKKRIASMKKTIAKLEARKFEVIHK